MCGEDWQSTKENKIIITKVKEVFNKETIISADSIQFLGSHKSVSLHAVNLYSDFLYS